MPPLTPRLQREPFPTSPYRLHPRIGAFFREFVVKPFEKHPFTRTWHREVATQDWGYQARLTDNGRSSFLKDKNDLPPEDLVLIYCYRYMQMHTVSGFHMFVRNLVDYKLQILRNLVFVDFGCGPLTCGISLAWYNYLASHNQKLAAATGLKVHYIGIDRSKAMLDHAQRATVVGNLFHSKSTFDFVPRLNTSDSVPALIDKYRVADGVDQFSVVLNCSYFFGSRVLNVELLVKFISGLMRKHLSGDKVCLTHQNASHSDVNVKWEEFKKGVKTLLPSVGEVGEQIQYYDITGRRTQPNPQSIKLRRELLLNEIWKDQLEIKDK
jgi:hypothetical protein